MAENFDVEAENFSKVERRFLLFQVDLGNRELNTVLGVRGATDKRMPQDSVRLSDPVDYDNPSSPIYWRKVSSFTDSTDNNAYVSALKDAFSAFLKQFQAAISDGTIKLKGTGGQAGGQAGGTSKADAVRPYIDMSDFVKSIDGYSVRMDSFDNKINVVLARPESTDLVSAAKAADNDALVINFNDDVFGDLNPNENDIIVVKSAYLPTDNFAPEYIGVVTRVQKSFVYGRLDSFTLEVSGLSKIFQSTQMIKNKSVRSNEFVPGIELNDKARISPYATNFNNKDVRGIFEYILEDSLACKEIDQDTATFLYRLDPSIFISFNSFGFQHNIFVLIALYLMSVTQAPDGASGSLESRLFPQLKPDTRLNSLVSGFNNDVQLQSSDAGVPPRSAQRPILDFFLRGVLERGDQKAYTKMARNGVLKFFSEMTKPADILGEVRSNSYSDVFESRDGVIVCRPPRYNKVEITTDEINRTSAEKTPELLLKLSPQNVWEFNPDSDFVIRSEEIIGVPAVSKDEMALESRIDVKPVFPFRGEVDFPIGLYIEPDILFRYGLRSHGAVTNPNAYNKRLARLFGPIALAMLNAPTRTIEITVKDSRKMFVGKLYYIEPIDMVAYLVGDTINHSNGSFTTRNLSFSMLRQVIRRPISAILGKSNTDEVLNVGMMFTDDFPNQTGLDILVADGFPFESPDAAAIADPTPKNLMYTKGKMFLEALQKKSAIQGPSQNQANTGSAQDSKGSNNGLQSHSDVRLVMFKYVPGIEDLIMEIESTPKFVDPPAETTSDVPAATKTAKTTRLKVFVDGSDYIYYVGGFKNGVQQNADLRLNYLPGIIVISSKPIDENRIDPSTPSLTDPINIAYAVDDINAPIGMAGLLNYVFPTLTAPGSIGVSYDFVEVPGGAPLARYKSPFLSSALSDPPTNLAISQLLTNKLVDFDLSMKFFVLGNQISVNDNGIQQYYYLSGQDFILFGTSRRPSDYLSAVASGGGHDPVSVSLFQNGILNSVGCLKMNKDMTALENQFFSIPIRDGAFDLPFGHFVLKFGSSPGDMGFYRVFGAAGSLDGGRYRIVPGTLKDEFLITPLDSQSKIEDSNNPGSITDQNSTLHLSSSNGLYFMSPFMEPTMERLLDIHMPPQLGGNLTSSDAQTQSKLSSKGILSSQAKRQSGQAINVSIDVLLIASKANIQIMGGQRPVATPLGSPGVPPIYRRFEQFGLNVFSGGNMTPILNALTGNLVLPDGTPLGQKELMVYTLLVQDSQENSYASRLQTSGTAVAGV